MGQPSHNFRCKLSAIEIKALLHLEKVFFQAKCKVKARNLHLVAPLSCLTFTPVSGIPCVFSNGRSRDDIFKTDVPMNNALVVEPLKSFCQLLDTFRNALHFNWLIWTQAVEVVEQGHLRLLRQEVLVALRISEAVDQFDSLFPVRGPL